MYSGVKTIQLLSYNNKLHFRRSCKIDTVKDTISFTNTNEFFNMDSYIQYSNEPIINFQLDEEQSKII